MKLSVIIPVYNEVATIEKVLALVEKQTAKRLGVSGRQIIVVDDGSTDGTREVLNKYKNRFEIVFHRKNKRLTQAMITGFSRVKGELILVQHADLEYLPDDWSSLIKPILSKQADMVMGSRYLNIGKKKRHFSLRYQVGGRGLTSLFNLLYGTNLTDIFTAHRAFTKTVMNKFTPLSEGFAFETELTAQAVKAKFKILEVPITYHPRTFEEGKKLHWHDGLDVVKSMIRNKFKTS